MSSVRLMAEKARAASREIALLSPEARSEILHKIADGLMEAHGDILAANKKDLTAGQKKGLPEGMVDRILLTESRIKSMADGVRKVAGFKDYIGQILEQRELPNGLWLKRVRVPLGVIGMIYEARPNVTADAAALALKSGNGVILKGGSDAMHSNKAIFRVIRNALKEAGGLAPKSTLGNAVQLIDTADRQATLALLGLSGLVDVIIPRGGRGLINFVREHSKIPVIETGASVVHTYIHQDADVKKAVLIVMNAKLRRVSICNTLDTLLLHKNIAAPFLKAFTHALPKNPYGAVRLEVRADAASHGILKKISAPRSFNFSLKKAKPDDFSTEFLDYVLAVKVVDGLDEALAHIDRYSLKHSEAIVCEDPRVAERFLKNVDAACVYWNASTQFSDGGEFGLGAEIGISTQKLHVRGPFAHEALTSYKWVIEGTGHIRK